jgi:hypothetical protein
MTTPQVWVSTTSPQIHFDGTGPGDHWELVGTIDTNQESEFNKHIQAMLGRKGRPRGSAEFYLSGDPDSLWVTAADRSPFWVAIDPFGAMRSRIHGAEPTYFVSNAQAVSVRLARREPEPHPGLRVRAVMVPNG